MMKSCFKDNDHYHPASSSVPPCAISQGTTIPHESPIMEKRYGSIEASSVPRQQLPLVECTHKNRAQYSSRDPQDPEQSAGAPSDSLSRSVSPPHLTRQLSASQPNVRQSTVSNAIQCSSPPPIDASVVQASERIEANFARDFKHALSNGRKAYCSPLHHRYGKEYANKSSEMRIKKVSD